MHELWKKNDIFNNKFGHFAHKDIIGKKYGSKVKAKKEAGWMHVLLPTPELWTLALAHRTQILYTLDISVIAIHLDLKPGSIVVESGTGSGSLSTSIARCISPSGHLYTFEFHEQRAQKAREDFVLNKIDHLITVTCRDVLKNGFGLEADIADAVFLDLPAPWDVVANAHKILRSDGAFCSFSPCIEQVQMTAEELRKFNFYDIKTIECLLRVYDVKSSHADVFDFSITNPINSNTTSKSKDKLKEEQIEMEIEDQNDDDDDDESGPSKDDEDLSDDESATMTEKLTNKRKRSEELRPTTKRTKKKKKEILLVKPFTEAKGHTGFLTFAKK